ncbi:MAG: hypothetical protein ACE5MB_02755 [Anaerolineae bacterium]
MLCGQILLAGALPAPTWVPLHPAWLLQDHLRAQIRQGTQQPWPFRPGRRLRPPQKRGPRPHLRTLPITWVETEATQPPKAWPDQVTALMDQEACRRLIQQVRWEEGLAL